MAYGTKGRITPRKKPKKAAKAGKVTTGGGAGRAIGAGLRGTVGKGTAGKAGRTIGGGRKPFMALGGGSVPKKKTPKKPAKRKPKRRLTRMSAG